MKRTIIFLASLFLIVFASSMAAAEMVNVGTVAMDRSELEDIRNLISGARSLQHTTATAPVPAEVNIGVATMAAADYVALQGYVSGHTKMQPPSGKSPEIDSVNIGLAEISKSDLHDIEELTSWIQKKGPGLLAIDAPVALLK